jgi:NAD(P) transhydrogenase subunit alpha
VKIGILSDEKAGEQRVAASPDMVKKLVAASHSIFIQSGAGAGSSISDYTFEKAGASVSASPDVASFDILLCVNLPSAQTLKALKTGALIIGQLAPFEMKSSIKEFAALNLSMFALEWLPRISRAQAMDVLSSQSNLAGYRAVIDAAYEFGKVIPMMMTAAGTVPPAKVLVLGAGVAGLQAIATAKRLGAVVSAFDVRPAVKEQVESLGAKFVEVKAEDAAAAETSGGYAKEMSEEYKRKQSELIHETLKSQDMVISTALIPGKPAPVLITEAIVKDMKSGSVIVDLAVASGGNCPLSEADKVVIKHGVKLIGYTNMPSRAAVDASPLYARNLLNFLGLLIDKEGKLTINTEDEIIKGTLLCHNGQVVHPNMQ